jgi:hypothetical protein
MNDNREPDFINEDGVKWWHQEGITKYAKFKNLPDIQGWWVELPSGVNHWVLTRNGQVIHDQGGIDALGMKIDLISASES